MNQKVKSTYKKLLADTLTPVSIYLRLRDKYAESILLESSDYHGDENSLSYICCEPLASFSASNYSLEIDMPNDTQRIDPIDKSSLINHFEDFKNSFEVEEDDFKFSTNGLFGYMTYNAVQHFEDLNIENTNDLIPDMFYRMYRFVIVVDHFKNEMYVFEHTIGEQKNEIDQLIALVKRNDDPQFSFNTKGDESSVYTDEEFLKMINNGIEHCHRGDVFQLVLSRRFKNAFQGDEFNVYRALRSINPSPYLFYFDFGSFKIFGSSPESQILINGDKASIFPIAGTFKRTGDDAADAELAKKLAADEKENSEHIMLVDLARNDLSRSSEKVEVEVFKEVQYYSHVIHLVSKVTGTMHGQSSMQLVADTFPAGTLSGAPKFKAMELIDKYESISRNYYAGAIGFVGFNGDYNHAIMIRSFLSKANELHYQAGAGIVAKSNPESELKEVDNKLAALRKAIKLAEDLV